MDKRGGKLRHGLVDFVVLAHPLPLSGIPPSQPGSILQSPWPQPSQAETSGLETPPQPHSPGPRSGRMDRPPHSRTLDSRMRSCFWQRDLVPRGHTRRCADTGRLPPGSRTSRFCRIRLLASAAMAPREEAPPNQQAPGARWAPPEEPSHQGMLLTLWPQLTAPPTGPEDNSRLPQVPPKAASSHPWALC